MVKSKRKSTVDICPKSSQPPKVVKDEKLKDSVEPKSECASVINDEKVLTLGMDNPIRFLMYQLLVLGLMELMQHGPFLIDQLVSKIRSDQKSENETYDYPSARGGTTVLKTLLGTFSADDFNEGNSFLKSGDTIRADHIISQMLVLLHELIALSPSHYGRFCAQLPNHASSMSSESLTQNGTSDAKRQSFDFGGEA